MSEDHRLNPSARHSTRYEWPCIFFKFIVPKEQTSTVLELFADDPVRARESRNGHFTAYTMEMYAPCDEVIAIYQRVVVPV